MPRVIFLFFFLSGLSALIFEVSWVRELALFLGNTAQATSTVLAVFMGGLALGAYLGGKQVDRLSSDPLAVYGILEIGVGVIALLVSLALQSASVFYVWFVHFIQLGEFSLTAIRLCMATGLLLLPTILMGATLPVLVRYLERTGLQSRLFSILYGINTLGAATGGLMACFLGFPFMGIQGTLFCAAAINVTIGISAVFLGRQLKSKTPDTNSFEPDSQQDDLSRVAQVSLPISEAGIASPTEEPPTNDALAQSALSSGISLRILCVISFLAGFTALSYEVLWTRILRCYIGSVTYAFSIMVSMFLLGLAAGSFIYEQRMLKSESATLHPLLTFSTIQFLAAFACAAGWLLFPQTADFSTRLLQVLFSSLQGYHIFYAILVCIPTILVPAIFIGILFPMIGTLAASQGKQAATSVGKVYAVNTIGCVCGSLVCGLVFVPTIGSTEAFRWIVVLSTLTGVLTTCFADGILRRARVALVGVPIALLAYYLSLHNETRAEPGCTFLATGEDSTGIIYVVSSPKEGGITLNVNHAFLSSTIPPARRYMRLLGHLPMLLHKDPQNVVIGCFGTGTTAGACALHPELKRLDIVDLSKLVLQFAPYFHTINYDVLKKPNVVAQVNDVRNFLLTTDRRFDVISFEPPPPSDAGIVNLYTEDFYRLAKSRLNTDGILCQWIPMHLVSAPVWKMQIASARAVFPHVSVWLSNSREAILLASQHPLELDVDTMQKRIDSTPQIKESLHDVGFDSATAVLSTYIAGGTALDDYIKGAPSITDNFPRLEFFLAYPGPYLSESDVESIGNTNVKHFVEENKNARGFDQADFWKNWQAIHLLREIDKRPVQQTDHLIDAAVKMYPTNAWFQYVSTHRAPFYPSGHADWKY